MDHGWLPVSRLEKTIDDVVLDDRFELVRHSVRKVIANVRRKAFEIGPSHLQVVMLSVGRIGRIDSHDQYGACLAGAIGGAAVDGKRRPG